MKNQPTNNNGIALLIAVIIVSALLSIAVSLSSIMQRHVELSSLGRESQVAFYGADSGLECALYWDLEEGAFSTSSTSNISCNDQPFTVGGNSISTFTIQPDGGTYCAEVRVEKSSTGSTTIVSRGYNECDTDTRRVERALRTTY